MSMRIIGVLCLLINLLLAAEHAPAWHGEMPTTAQEWTAIPGGVVTYVNLKNGECATPVELKPGQQVYIVPHPEDQWACTWNLANPTPISWRGDLTQPAGYTKQLQIKVYPTTGVTNGVTVFDGKQKLTGWTNVADLTSGIWTGPGKITFRGVLVMSRGFGQGSIRVKIVPIRS